MQWFRFYSETIHDRKIEYISRNLGHPRALIVGIWAIVLALANDSPERGSLLLAPGVPMASDDLAAELDLDREDAEQILELFKRLGMIDHNEGLITVCNWDKRQYTSDNSTSRVQRHRERKAAAEETLQVTEDETLQKRYRNAPHTDSDTDTDSDTESETEQQQESDVVVSNLTAKLISLGIQKERAEGLVGAEACNVIEGHILHYQHAQEQGTADGPGWLVKAIEEGWLIPTHIVNKLLKQDRTRYTTGKYADAIQS